MRRTQVIALSFMYSFPIGMVIDITSVYYTFKHEFFFEILQETHVATSLHFMDTTGVLATGAVRSKAMNVKIVTKFVVRVVQSLSYDDNGRE